MSNDERITEVYTDSAFHPGENEGWLAVVWCKISYVSKESPHQFVRLGESSYKPSREEAIEDAVHQAWNTSSDIYVAVEQTKESLE